MSEEINDIDDVDESITFSFVEDGDLQIETTCTDPGDLALLYYSIISGRLTEYFMDTVRGTLDDDDYEVFLEELVGYTSLTQEEEPLIKPSELFEGREE